MSDDAKKLVIDEVLLEDLGKLAGDLANARRWAKRLNGRVSVEFTPEVHQMIRENIAKRVPATKWIMGDMRKTMQAESGPDGCAACAACAICLADGPFPDFEVAALTGLASLW